MKGPARFFWLLPPVVLLAPGCGDSGSTTAPATDWVYRPPAQVGDGWETASLESVGMDPAPLMDLMDRLYGRSTHLVHGILIVRHERLVSGGGFSGTTSSTCRVTSPCARGTWPGSG
jgi:hypothetical protein